MPKHIDIGEYAEQARAAVHEMGHDFTSGLTEPDPSLDQPESLLVAGTVALSVAGGLASFALVTASFLLGGLSLALGGASLFVMHTGFRGVCGARPGRCAAWGLAAFAGGGVFIALGVNARSWQSALFGTWLAAAGLAAFSASARDVTSRRTRRDDAVGSRTLAAWSLLSFAMTAIGFSLFLRASPDWALVAGGLLLTVGFLMASLTVSRLSSRRPELWTAVGGVLSIAGGLAVVQLVRSGGPPGTIAVAALLAVSGLVPLSKGIPELTQHWSRFPATVTFAAGLAVAAIATAAFSRAAWPNTWIFAVVVFALLSSAALVADSVELAAFLLAGIVIAAVVADRTDYSLPSPDAGAPQRIVALGDSYIAGEGASTFLPGTNVVGQNECRRSTAAYPYLVAATLGMHLDFYACSGAVTSDIVDTGQQLGSPEAVVGRLPQLDNLDPAERPIAAVIVSIGGNDAWFGEIGQACFAPASCDVHRTTVFRNIAKIGSNIANVYEEIITKVGRDVPVVVVPYPLTATPGGCQSSPLTHSEHQFIFQFTEVLNDQLRTQADRVGVNFFGEAVGVFAGSRICDTVDSPAMNVVSINPKEGGLLHRMAPTNWTHGSAHPTAHGHELIAHALTDYLEELWDGIDAGHTQANPEPDPFAQPRVDIPDLLQPVSTSLLDIPTDLGCPASELSVTALTFFAGLGERKDLAGLEPGSPICSLEADGSWSDDLRAGEDGRATLTTWEPDAVADRDHIDARNAQIVIAQLASGDWRVRVYQFCELDPNCADTDRAIQGWMYAQIGSTASQMIVPGLAVFLGAWFGALHVKRHLIRRSRARQ